MRKVCVSILAMLFAAGAAHAQKAGELGTEEFGLTTAQLVANVERVEALISQCMRKQGFEYVAVDYLTVRKGMSADKSLPGVSEEDFLEKYGFGIATLYTGQPPQLNEGYSPARVGLGQRNVEIYRSLSQAERIAYTRALCGADASATFAVGLETEDFSRCGGCTRQAVEEVFGEEPMQASYYNPVDARINDDPRMKKALREYAKEMRAAGFDYSHPDEVEADIRTQLNEITDSGTLPLEALSTERRAALSKLREYERRVAILDHDLAQDLFDPVEEKIQSEMFSRDVK